MSKLEKVIFYLFALLFFLVPLAMWVHTSEVFEFNKIVVVYFLATSILTFWVIRMILERKIIFRRTILDIPLLLFLGSQFLSTIFSIDVPTSIFGYYSRFNGGLISLVSYSILYWAYVSNIKNEDSKKHLIILIATSLITAGLAIGEHFGIFLTCGLVGSVTANCWQQDVQTRVFSTFGQPNWLATWITAISPITWFFATRENIKSQRFWVWTIISIIFYATLLFTRSRSGIAGYTVAFFIFYLYSFLKEKPKFLVSFKKIVITGVLFLIPTLIFGTPWTPRVDEIISHKITSTNESVTGPALETGGTESGTIRKIVWQGAIQVFLHYPILGSGVETFAYSYYQYRPVAHNLVSEWDFIYNKAHNEYLNFMATTGAFGILTYLIFIGFSIYLMLKTKNIFTVALTAGYSSILISNFFGFSVVPVEIEFFLFPAFAVAASNLETKTKDREISFAQKAVILIVIAIGLYAIVLITNYWYADTLYSKGKSYNSLGKPGPAIPLLARAIELEPYQAIYQNEISVSYTLAAQDAYNQKDSAKVQENVNNALSYSQKAINLSPANLNIRRSRFGIFLRLSSIDPRFLIFARDTLTTAITFAPTDAKLYYNLGLTEVRTGQTDEAAKTFEKTIELKANYKEARLAYAILLIDKKEYQKARDQLTYILTKIDPNDTLTKQTLQEIK